MYLTSQLLLASTLGSSSTARMRPRVEIELSAHRMLSSNHWASLKPASEQTLCSPKVMTKRTKFLSQSLPYSPSLSPLLPTNLGFLFSHSERPILCRAMATLTQGLKRRGSQVMIMRNPGISCFVSRRTTKLITPAAGTISTIRLQTARATSSLTELWKNLSIIVLSANVGSFESFVFFSCCSSKIFSLKYEVDAATPSVTVPSLLRSFSVSFLLPSTFCRCLSWMACWRSRLACSRWRDRISFL
mmetsp:Transcript_22763/g.51305  ORF Transcript_22763/g.51305 Transcript_22763/m.51305 type:complete len:245 (+) Transcript_22763:353-1087(+)